MAFLIPLGYVAAALLAAVGIGAGVGTVVYVITNDSIKRMLAQAREDDIIDVNYTLVSVGADKKEKKI